MERDDLEIYAYNQMPTTELAALYQFAKAENLPTAKAMREQLQRRAEIGTDYPAVLSREYILKLNERSPKISYIPQN
jgi:hypothetical protein